jgi:hypothetical protein
MSETATVVAQPVPPEAQLIEMLMAPVVPRLLHVAATLKLADRLSEAPKTAEELAESTATHAPALYRLMRTLASVGVFKEDQAHRFSLSPIGETLLSGAPGRATALIIGGDLVWRSLEHALYSVQTGNTGFEKAYGKPLFNWLADQPEEAALFGETMVGFHGTEPEAVAAAYDFSRFSTIADIGGATGNMLTTILAKHPGTCGILFDLPHAVPHAGSFIQQSGMTGRIQIEAGNFFETVPTGADAYILSHVIHDWSEEQCLTILGHCRRAMNGGGRLLIVEMVLPEGDTPHFGKMLDILMLMLPGGRERTEPEYRELLEKAGFRLTRVVHTASLVSIVEAAPR